MTSRSKASAPSVDTSRRTFRGKSGPTDRRLPKSQARRRREHPGGDEQEARNSKYGDKDDSAQRVGDDLIRPELESGGELISNTDSEVIVESTGPIEHEIQHLMRRVRNVRESIQLSKAATANPSTWQQNVLNPTRNCVGEWRAIVSHYDDECLYPPDLKSPSLKVFELIQFSLQSGPLAGAKPGYFKRCGASVARQALKYIDDVVPNQDEAALLGFSCKQVDAIQQWRINAERAVDSDKPPSKSVLKKQNKSKMK